MSKETETEKYLFSFFQRGLEARMKPTSKKHRVKASIFFATVLILLVFFSTSAFFQKEGIPYGIIGLSIAIVMVLSYHRETVSSIKREQVFKLEIDEYGVKQTEIDRCYVLEWKDITSFGFLNYNMFNRPDNSDTEIGPHQMCLYFSKTVFEEEQLRKKLRYTDHKKYKHCNTDEIIVFGFAENNPDEETCTALRELITAFCDPSIERSFVNSEF